MKSLKLVNIVSVGCAVVAFLFASTARPYLYWLDYSLYKAGDSLLSRGVTGISKESEKLNNRYQHLTQSLVDLQWKYDKLAAEKVLANQSWLLVKDAGLPYKVARVFKIHKGPKRQFALIADSKQQLVKGTIAVDGDVVVGKVLGSQKGVAELSLVSDSSSRLPAFIKHTDVSAVLLGRGSGPMQLTLIKDQAKIKSGDEVLLNMPEHLSLHGLKIGVVSEVTHSSVQGYMLVSVLPYHWLDYEKWLVLQTT